MGRAVPARIERLCGVRGVRIPAGPGPVRRRARRARPGLRRRERVTPARRTIRGGTT
jgi:hypothetical protein